MIKGYGNMTN